ncbi:MAG: hexokinase [Planctomycetes bacterium GWF2_42_9]|nr:MAG: hexokinase [Planctomycetes bacterium GWF2_42_9]HAL45563.1 hexokinase [Phycisphaerales bacterium]
MKNTHKAALTFLEKHQMDHQSIDIDKNVKVFIDEMQRGLEGQKSSLDMIPTFIEVKNDIPINKPVIVIDAGGTNFRCATVKFNEKREPVVENLKKNIMPGVEREVTKEEFFDTMAYYIRDIINVSEKIGFCFSYPTEILPNKDGKLLRFAKEIKIKQVLGETIGKNLNLGLQRIGLPPDKQAIILNDTVASLLGGVNYKNRVFSGYIGFILGTGTNCCYIEKNANIKKRSDLELSSSQIINCESGGFGKFQAGEIDIAFDKSTSNPGVHVFEKYISGAYLGSLCLLTLQTAAKDGLFSKNTADEIANLKNLGTIEINEFMYYPYGYNRLASICKKGETNDTQLVYYICDSLVERAAKLSAINISAMAIKSQCQTSPNKPICIVAEGTTFYNLKNLKSRTEYYLKQYLENELEIYYDIISVDNATLIGAAIAGLTN